MSLLHKFDQRFFACIRRAWVVQRQDEFLLALETNLTLPPRWLETLTVTLVHDDGQIRVLCQAAWQDLQCSTSTARLSPLDTCLDLKKIFSSDKGPALCLVGQVLLTGTQADITLNNGTSRSAYLKTKTSRSQEPIDGLIASLDTILIKQD